MIRESNLAHAILEFIELHDRYDEQTFKKSVESGLVREYNVARLKIQVLARSILEGPDPTNNVIGGPTESNNDLDFSMGRTDGDC